MKRDRGEYRPIYEVLLDGPDWQRLSSDARLVFVALKLKCGGFGIRIIAGLVESLSQWTGLSSRRCVTACKSLEQSGWIQRDGNVVWVVRGLEFEPTMDAANANHRKAFARLVDALPSLPIVGRFRACYPQWATPSPSNGIGQGIPDAIAITTTTTSTTTSTSTTTNSKAAGGKGERSEATGIEEALALTIAANQAITAKYGEQPDPIIANAGSSFTAAKALREAGVPLDFAKGALGEIVATMALEVPPRSLKYFVAAIQRRWEAETAHRQVRSAPIETNGSPNAPPGEYSPDVLTRRAHFWHALLVTDRGWANRTTAEREADLPYLRRHGYIPDEAQFSAEWRLIGPLVAEDRLEAFSNLSLSEGLQLFRETLADAVRRGALGAVGTLEAATVGT